MLDVDTSRTPEEGAYSPSWPNGLTIILLVLWSRQGPQPNCAKGGHRAGGEGGR